MVDLVAIADEKDEDKLREFFANEANLVAEADDGSTAFHLAALANNAVFFNVAVDALHTDQLELLQQRMTATFDDDLTPVHVAVMANAVDVLRTLNFSQQNYDIGYIAALRTPADEEKRPAALAVSLYGKDHEISALVYVIKDAAGVVGRALGYDYACEFVARRAGTPIQPRTAPENGLRVLSLDGGGSRGVIAIGALARLQDQLDGYVGDCFDVICGTSTGAIIAMAIVYLRMPMKDLKTMYINLAQGMFKRKLFKEFYFNGAMYDTEFLRTTVQGLVPNTCLSDLPDNMAHHHRPMLIATAATEHDWAKHHVFGNYVRRDLRVPFPLINDCTVWQACRATSAAPTYFTPKQLEQNGTKFVDGGVYANNPINVAVREARAVFGHDVKFRAIVSLGCGYAKEDDVRKTLWTRFKGGVLGVLKSPLPEFASSGARALSVAVALASDTTKHDDEFVGNATHEMLAVYTRVTMALEPKDAKLDVGDAKVLEAQYVMGYSAMDKHVQAVATRIRNIATTK